ncbi:uncharacterized protein PAC_08748 [Phialocephala subalpina]|uniref:Uncharacterized protein n=1 Tax=Phialocephala subalpina TaxID=576137 RepID=A0A1L7X1E5_9HELO|nr:uncharacterized protein PAC_08748 [Phialocephala subalpina]
MFDITTTHLGKRTRDSFELIESISPRGMKRVKLATTLLGKRTQDTFEPVEFVSPGATKRARLDEYKFVSQTKMIKRLEMRKRCKIEKFHQQSRRSRERQRGMSNPFAAFASTTTTSPFGSLHSARGTSVFGNSPTNPSTFNASPRFSTYRTPSDNFGTTSSSRPSPFGTAPSSFGTTSTSFGTSPSASSTHSSTFDQASSTSDTPDSTFGTPRPTFGTKPPFRRGVFDNLRPKPSAKSAPSSTTTTSNLHNPPSTDPQFSGSSATPKRSGLSVMFDTDSIKSHKKFQVEQASAERHEKEVNLIQEGLRKAVVAESEAKKALRKHLLEKQPAGASQQDRAFNEETKLLLEKTYEVTQKLVEETKLLLAETYEFRKHQMTHLAAELEDTKG